MTLFRPVYFFYCGRGVTLLITNAISEGTFKDITLPGGYKQQSIL